MCKASSELGLAPFREGSGRLGRQSGWHKGAAGAAQTDVFVRGGRGGGRDAVGERDVSIPSQKENCRKQEINSK